MRDAWRETRRGWGKAWLSTLPADAALKSTLTRTVYSACLLILLGASLGCLGGCAPALPSLTGGGITPAGRVDMAAGGSARVPLGGLRSGREARQPLEHAMPGGLAPLVETRFALADRFDLDLLLSATTLRLGARHGIPLGEYSSLIAAVAPFAGWVAPPDWEGKNEGDGLRYGVQLPVTVAFSVGGVYEAWTGPRLGIERARADTLERGVGEIELVCEGLRAGWLVGFAVGFRRAHVLVELVADHEWWRLERGEERRDASGFSLTPAFALRIRF